MMAALAVVGAILTGCSSEDVANEAPQAKTGNKVIQTTTISLGGGATTRALDASGQKTFAVGDQIAVFYRNVNNELQLAESAALTAADISSDGKTAVITVQMTDPMSESPLRYVYPFAMARSDYEPAEVIDNTINYNKLSDDQDGTLATLASKFDLAVYDGNLTSNGGLPGSATLKNQLNVALYPTPGSNKENITVTATANDDTKYEKDFKFNFAANNIYPIAVKTFKVVDVSTLTIPEGENAVEYTAQNGDMLTGTIANYVLIRIAENANVALKNLTIDYKAPPGSNFYFHNPGITCIGNATIILEGTNKVKAFEDDFPGISAATNNSTLTIKGDGSLEAIGQMGGAGIGGGNGGNCGNIVIESGSITATGGNYAAGIGSGYNSSCGNILISGGTVKATGGNNAAGIGTGDGDSSCGSITITNGVKEVIAKKGTNADCSIGKGNGNSSCGKVTI